MRTIELNNTVYQIDSRLEGFMVSSKPSSNVAFYGYSLNNSFFIQFKNGSAYIFSDVSESVLAGVNKAVSIGAYFNSEIKGKFPNEKLAGSMVTRKEMAA